MSILGGLAPDPQAGRHGPVVTECTPFIWPCRSRTCGRLVELASPLQGRVLASPTNEVRVDLWRIPGEESHDLCVQCRVNAADPEHQTHLRARLAPMLALKRELDIPSDFLAQRIIFRDGGGEEGWAGYDLELFGIQVGDLAPGSPLPSLHWTDPSSTETVSWLLYRRAVVVLDLDRTKQVDGALAVDWHPVRGESPLKVIGWDRITKAERDRLHRGEELLRLFSKRGAPQIPVDDDVNKVLSAIRAVRDDPENPKKPTQDNVATHLYAGENARYTLRAQLKRIYERTGLTWADLLRIA